MFSFTSIGDYQNHLLNGQASCVEAVLYFLDNIKTNSHLNAFLEVYKEEALQQARQLDENRRAGKAIGKLHGVVVALKDVICYKDHHVSAASKILEGFTSIYNATVVEKLLAEEAIIIGRNNCDEFAMGSSNENSAYGNVRNAIDNSRVSGGSSGGSAVAVQADLCMISLGSDTGGSVRQPADFCGIVGLKPSYGCVSRYGLIAYASSFDQIGIFGKTIDDVALTLEVIKGSDEYDSTITQNEFINDNGKKRDIKIAYFRQALEHPSLDEEIAQTVKAFMKNLSDAGYITEPVEFDLFNYIVPAYYILTTAEAASNLSRYDGIKYGEQNPETTHSLTKIYSTRSTGFGKEVKRRIMLGNFVLSAGYCEAYFTKAQQVRTMIINQAKAIFNTYDFIISPTVPSAAFKFGEKSRDPVEMFLGDIYTVFANLTGIAAISIPLFKHNNNNMPFGIQLMTYKNNELSLLLFSKKLIEIYKDCKVVEK